jgi:hypothetical protein
VINSPLGLSGRQEGLVSRSIGGSSFISLIEGDLLDFWYNVSNDGRTLSPTHCCPVELIRSDVSISLNAADYDD